MAEVKKLESTISDQRLTMIKLRERNETLQDVIPKLQTQGPILLFIAACCLNQ